MIMINNYTRKFKRLLWIALTVWLGALSNHCSTAEIRGTQLASDFSRGEFDKYYQIADNNSNIKIVVPCDSSQVFQNRIWLSGSDECKSRQPGNPLTFVHEKDSGDFRSSLERAKECYKLQLTRENRFLDEKGMLKKDGASTSLSVITHSLYEVQKRCDNFDLFWKYNDPVKLAYEKEMDLRRIEESRTIREKEAKDQKIAEEAEKKRRIKVQSLKKKYRIESEFPQKMFLAQKDTEWLGKNYVYSCKIVTQLKKSQYFAMCNEWPSLIESKPKLSSDTYYDILGRFEEYEYFTGIKDQIPVIKLLEVIEG